MDPINKKLFSLSEISKEILKKILSSCCGKKYLIFEPNIIKPLEKICGAKWLKENNVEKLFKFDTNTPTTFEEAVVPVYMIFSNIIIFKSIIDHINSILSKYTDITTIPQGKFHVIIVPSALNCFESLLEELGLYDVVVLHSFQWFPIYLDENLLSLENAYLFKNIYVKNDYSDLPVIAKSLWQLFCVTGKPNYVLGLGQHSCTVLKQLEMFTNDLGKSTHLESDFGACIIMDRSVDYTSALLTPVTYTSLINEIYDIKCGIIDHKEDVDAKYDEKFNPIIKKEQISFILNTKEDTVYAKIKHRHFSEVTTILSELTKRLRTEGETSKNISVDEMKKYVSTKLQKLTMQKKCLANHLLVAETIVKTLGHKFEKQQSTESSVILNKNKSSNYWYLDEMLCTDNNKFTSLRLFSLIGLTQKLNYEEVKNFKQKYLHEFGYHLLYVFHNLKTAGLFTEPAQTKIPNISMISNLGSNKNFYNTVNKLKQIPPDPDKINLKAPTCCSYVFGGFYIPLIIQIISMILNDTSIQEIKSKLENISSLTITKPQHMSSLQPRCILVHVIGGLTYAEVAACNLLETLTSCKIILSSDCVLSGNNIMEAVM